MAEVICKHFEQSCNSKACKYYQATKTNKVGLCMLKMKKTLLCHYSEKALGKYTGDTEIVKTGEL
jgi:hypothetical protein